MTIYEIGTGYTSIPAKLGAATEIVVEELTKSLIKAQKNVFIVDIKDMNRIPNDLPIIEVTMPSVFMKTDVKLGFLHKLKRVVYSIKLACKLKELIRKGKTSGEKIVFHFHNQYNMFFFLLLTTKKIRKQCFVAYTNHSYIWHGEWEQIKNKVRIKYFQEIVSMKNADRVYVLNRNTVNTINKHIGVCKTHIQLIDNGVNTEKYYPYKSDDAISLKEKMGMSGKKICLQIGSVCARKNQLEAIRLLLPLMKEDKNIVFMYAGGIISPEYQLKIIEYSKNHELSDQIKYLGELKPGEELNQYYNLADVIVCPSKLEGFSLVIIEAMAAGVPVIISENLQFDLSGECLKYKTDKDFIDIIEHVIFSSEKQQKLSIHVRNLVVANYSWDKIAGDYFESWNQGE